MGAIDGGTLEDVTFSDITMRNIVNHPIFVRLSVRDRAPRDAGVATVRLVRFVDLNVSVANGRPDSGLDDRQARLVRAVHFYGVPGSSEDGGPPASSTLEPPEPLNSPPHP